MIIEPTIDSKRIDKKTIQLARNEERDSKLLTSSMISSYLVPNILNKWNSAASEERAESLPITKKAHIVPKLIESCNRFMSVRSRPIGCRTSAPATSFTNVNIKLPSLAITSNEKKPKTSEDLWNKRNIFYDKFSNLIKLGSIDKSSKISQEEKLWQTEAKDLIWLELQAWHADRNVEDEDQYLYSARQSIGDLLREIMIYKFDRTKSNIYASVDSGVSINDGTSVCSGCISMYCKDCLAFQTSALTQVESLLSRLEQAESLFQSTKAFGSSYPLYKSEAFTGRIKALCLWYNMTRHHRLKLLILGKLLARLHSGKQHPWPITDATEVYETHIDTSDEQVSASMEDNIHELTCDVGFPANQVLCPAIRSVTKGPESSFVCDTSTPEEITKGKSPYRKYIENVLKSRGLGKSLSFLHRLHNVVLRKARITLEKPGESDLFEDSDLFDEDTSVIELIEPPMDCDQIEELRKYGIWSKEAKDLSLPSYVPAFLFLSLIPLEVIHEFLRMRLETVSKVSKPNLLSLEQILKELREGLSLAMIHRERYKRHISTALNEEIEGYEKHMSILKEFNKTCQHVFELYLTYAEDWIVKGPSDTCRRLDEEWRFVKLISPMMTGQHIQVCQRFSSIIQQLFKEIGNTLVTKITYLDNQAEHSISIKWQLFTICRETQQLFTKERENMLKILVFVKNMCKDIEKPEFHREHNEDLISDLDKFLCREVRQSVTLIKKEALEFNDVLINIISLVQRRCDVKNLTEMEEQDKLAVITRSREIMHEGFKFGFEFLKEMQRIHEMKVASCKDSKCEQNFALMTINFGKLWMKFVTERTDRGRGVRPTWANQAFEFLIAMCDPHNTSFLSETEFEVLKEEISSTISHVVGEPDIRKSARSHRNSPLPRPRTPLTPTTPQLNRYASQLSTKSSSSLTESSPQCSTNIEPLSMTTVDTSFKIEKNSRECKQIRIRDAIRRLDFTIDHKLREKSLIGTVKVIRTADKLTIRARSVNFSWHRGMKIGQGRFGTVYTAVNNVTGELMAMKEIPITPGETRAIKRVAEELKIFEGIQHKHLVKYYGVEIHREELLIFMELCSEGTLESIIELSGGLHESMTRRYTAQLLLACQVLHQNGIAHRDIKPANIFLTNDRGCLKLGDFGSAVKIEAHTTMPGELKGYVGTQAYMAPEVFTKTNTDGHGRAADIYSLGCCVIEMSSGKRPWHQFDSSFQIMFKVGMGENAEIPENLSQEGKEFVDLCLKHDPKERPNASELLLHNFCKVNAD
ncbi:mitogen-activated protein kinase kinase kinase 4 isoform X2 [Culicoides brevitarsis]